MDDKDWYNNMNYDREGYHLADLLRQWMKKTFTDYTVVKDVNSKLWFQTEPQNHDWIKIDIILSQASLRPKLTIVAERKDDGTVLYNHLYQILENGIQDTWGDKNTNYAYDSNFLEKLKVEIENIVKGDWVEDHV